MKPRIPIWLDNIKTPFPPIQLALKEPDGLLAIGGDLSSQRITNAYQNGIFPWYSEQEPILWWSPHKRAIVNTRTYKIQRTLAKILKKKQTTVSINKDFKTVITICATINRKNQDGTWINQDIIKAYTQLHNEKKALSIEVWQDHKMIGGLYGVIIGKLFSGESMFSKQSNASKIAFHYLCTYFQSIDIQYIDCQIMNPYLASLGAINISQQDFLTILKQERIKKITIEHLNAQYLKHIE